MRQNFNLLPTVCFIMPLAFTPPAESTMNPPYWYEANRVQAHSEHGLEAALRMTPQTHARALKSLGADALCRIYLTRDEGAWWQSDVGEIHPLIGDREFAREISDAIHEAGLKCIAYYRHMSDGWVQRERPNWLCVLPDGKPMLEPRGKTDYIFVPCLNSPYRDYIKTRLLELCDRGVDGFYLDNRHMPDVCTCHWCRGLFRQKYGQDMNTSAEPGSPEYMEMVSFVNESMVEAFEEWQDAVTAANSNVFILVKTSQYPNFFSPHMNTELLRNAIVVGTEFNKQFGHNTSIMKSVADFAEPAYDDQMALAWSIVRDGAEGRPPHMWIPHVRAKTIAEYSAAAAVAYGCVAALNIRLHDFPGDLEDARGVFSSSFQMGHKVSPYLANTRPLAMAALHVSERVRNKHLPDLKDLWPAVFGPVIGGYRLLKEEHVPWVVVSDLDLAGGIDEQTSLLVLPWPDELTEQERRSVQRFRQKGGQVIKLDPAAGWYLNSRLPQLLAESKGAVRKAMRKMPVQIEGPEQIHAVTYHQKDKNRLVICLANTWGWFRSTPVPNPALNNGKEPPPCKNMQITLLEEWLNPSVVFDAATGTNVDFVTKNNKTVLYVPEFQIQSFIVVQYK